MQQKQLRRRQTRTQLFISFYEPRQKMNIKVNGWSVPTAGSLRLTDKPDVHLFIMSVSLRSTVQVFYLITVTGPGLVVCVVAVAAAGGAVSVQQVCGVLAGCAAAHLVTQRTVGGAG